MRELLAKKLLLLLLAVTLIAAACGSSGDDELSAVSADQASADDAVFYSAEISEESAQPQLEPPNDEPYNDTFFENYGVNPRIDTEDDPLSTFALDVDTGSYTIARAWINDGSMPDKDSVRVEEFVNYFDQGIDAPLDAPFSISADGGPTPFMENDRYQLVRLVVQSKVVPDDDRPDAKLTFVIDVSGSMSEELPKVQSALETLVESLRPSDEVAIVVYGSNSRVLLDHTPVANSNAILGVLDELTTDGSTNAEEGLRIGYTQASEAFDSDAINRVILLSDGVANVGNTGSDSILDTIKESSIDGINLVTVGFGLGNYNDTLMEQLANDGDGFYAYVDTQREAERLFSNDLTGTLLTVAKDAKTQVEFNPETVERYRLIGFENRAIADEDFRDDTIDAGEIGAGHTVTALYEIKLDDSVSSANSGDVLATTFLRWEDPQTGAVTEYEKPVLRSDLAASYDATAPHFQLSATVAAWAEVMRESYFATEGGVITIDAVAAEAARLADGPLADDVNVAELADLTGVALDLR